MTSGVEDNDPEEASDENLNVETVTYPMAKGGKYRTKKKRRFVHRQGVLNA